MSKSQKILLGVLTSLPLVFIGLYIFTFFSFFVHMAELDRGNIVDSTDFFPGNFFNLFIFLGLFFLTSVGLLIYYLIHISKNEKFKKAEESNSKLIWILIVIFTGFIGKLVYFFMEIWPEKREEKLEVVN